MKKTLTLLALACATNLMAQQGFHMGVKVAPISTWMLNQEDSDAPADEFAYVSTWGLMAGASFNYHFMDNLGVGIDVLYSAQGQKSEHAWFGDDILTLNRRLSYLKIPLLLHFNTSPAAAAQFVGYIGPQLSLLSGVKYNYYTSDSTISNSYEGDLKSFYSSSNIGIALGLGVGFSLSDAVNLNIGLRFDYDFTDAEDKEALIEGTPFKYWPDGRPATNNLTGGLEVGLRYVLY